MLTKAFRLYLETSCIAFCVRPKGEAAKKRSSVKSKRYKALIPLAVLAATFGDARAETPALPFVQSPTEIAVAAMALADGNDVALPENDDVFAAGVVALLLTSEVGVAELYEDVVGGDDDGDTGDDPYADAYALLLTLNSLIQTLPDAHSDADVADLLARLNALMPTPQRPATLDADPEAAEVIGQALVGALERATGAELYLARDLRRGMQTVAHLVAHGCNARGFDHQSEALFAAATFYFENDLEAPMSIMASAEAEIIEAGIGTLVETGSGDIDACFDVDDAFDAAMTVMFPEASQ